MEGEHAQMSQIPCKMTNSSSKPLQTLGKWYQPRNQKKNPKPAKKKILKLFHTHNKWKHLGDNWETRWKGDKVQDTQWEWETRFQGSQNLAHTWAYIGERGRNRDTTPACDRKKEGGD
jgi:hypothetical protein